MYQLDSRARDRFLTKIHVTPGCWEWTAGRATNGYGMLTVKVNGRWGHGLAHRISYQIFVSTALDSQVVMHTCDNRGCVRPDHLRLGTQSDNIRDMDMKGRRNLEKAITRGTSHYNARITDDDVRDIRKRYTGKYGNATALAKEYGMTSQNIRTIGLRLGWRHVSDELS